MEADKPRDCSSGGVKSSIGEAEQLSEISGLGGLGIEEDVIESVDGSIE